MNSRPDAQDGSQKTWLLEHPGLGTAYIANEDTMNSRSLRLISDNIASNHSRRTLCLAFTTGGSVDFIHLAPSQSSNDVLDVARIFPNGALSARITCVPGTSFKLEEDYRIIVSNGNPNAPPNAAARILFGVNWSGNIVMAKYGQSGEAVDIPYESTTFIVMLLKSWLINMQNLRTAIDQRG